jgi:hypothetical protein
VVTSWKNNFNRNHPIGNFGKEPAKNEAKQKAAPGLADQVLGELARRSTEIQGNFFQSITQVQTDIRNAVNPTLQHRADQIGTKGIESVDQAHGTALRGLRRQTRNARRAVADMRRDALQQLASRRRAARAGLERQAQEAMAEARREASTAIDTVTTSLNQSLPHYGNSAQRFYNTLTNADAGTPEALSGIANSAAPPVVAAMEEAQAMQGSQLQKVRSSVQFRLESRLLKTSNQLGLAVSDAAGELQTGALETGSRLSETAERMTAGFAAVADGVNSAAENWAMPLAQVFADFIAAKETELTNSFPEFLSTVNARSNEFTTWVQPQLVPETFPFLQNNLQTAWNNVSENLETRIEGIASSFDAGLINKIDEAGVTGALRGVTRAQGTALRFIWMFERNEGSLDQDLLRNLDAGTDDYNAAINYLNGNTAAGARFELEASMHWYNDEEDRIKAVMRSLTPEQLQELHGLADWAETQEDVREALDEDALDINVFDALNAGNHAQADAYEMRDRIRRARERGDDDAMNTVLAEYSRAPSPTHAQQYGGHEGQSLSTAERWAAVQREFANIQGEGTTAEGQPITQEQASQVLLDYATDPIEMQQYGGQGETHTYTLTVSQRQQDLARELIYHGEGSVEARAARLGVEVDRRGGPNILNLDTALVDPRLNPNNPVPPEVREQARQEREQVLARFAERYGSPGAGATESVEAARGDLITQVRNSFGSETTGADLAEGLIREEHPSPATAAIAMDYAMESGGTREDLIDRTLGRMNRDEIRDMRNIFDAQPGRDLYAELGVFGHGSFGELSGDDRLRTERNLLGQPRNDRERAEVAAFAIQQQRDETGGFGSWLAGGSYQERSLDYNEARLARMMGGPIQFGPDGEPLSGEYTERFDDEGNFRGDSAEFGAAMVGSQLSAQNYSAKIDQYANFAATAIAVAGAIAAAVATVLTGGAASPLLMAAIAGVTGLTAMGAQAAIKGGRYGWEQAATDLGMTAVQALTAGVGQGLSLASRGGVQGLQAGMRTGLSMSAARQLAGGQVLGNMGRLTGSAFLDKALIGAVGGGLGSLGQTALSEQTYAKGAGGAAENLLFGLLRGAVAGGATATVSNAIEDMPLGSAGSRLLGRGTLGEAIGESTSVLGRGLGKGLTSGIGGFTGRSIELGLDSARGTYSGDAGDILVASAESGLQSTVQGIGEGGAEALAQRRFNTRYRPTAARPTPNAETEPAAGPTPRPVAGPGPEAETGPIRIPQLGETEPPRAVTPEQPRSVAPDSGDGGDIPRRPAGGGGGDDDGSRRPLTPEEQRAADVLESMLTEIHGKRQMAPGGGLVDDELQRLPQAQEPALRPGERPAGRSEISARVAGSLRSRARRAFGRALQDALQDPSLHTPLTLKTLDYLSPDQIDFVIQTGQLPRGFEFDHFLAVADFPEFAHRPDVGTALPKDVHREAAHAGDTTRPREAATMLDPEAETRPPVHLDPESAGEPSPALKPREQQIAEGLTASDDIDSDILIEQRVELARMQAQAATARRRGKPDTALERQVAAMRTGIEQLEQQIAAARQTDVADDSAITAPQPEAEAVAAQPRVQVEVPETEPSPLKVRVEIDNDAPESSRQRAIDEAEAIAEAAAAEERPVQVSRVGKSGTAAGIEGSDFRGDALRRPRKPDAVLDEASQAVHRLGGEGSTAEFASVDSADPTRLKVRPATGGEELTVRIATTDSMPAAEDGLVPVARFSYNEQTGEYEILVSARAPEGTLERALAHELTEIRAAHGRADIPDALRPGGFGAGPGRAKGKAELSPHDRGRLAELEVLSRQIAAARESGNEPQLARLRDESQRLLAHLGLVDDTPAARARLEAVQSETDGQPAVRQLLDAEIEAAQNNPFLRLPPTEPKAYADFLIERLQHAQRMGDTARVQQVLEQAQNNLAVSRSEFDVRADGSIVRLPSPVEVVAVVTADGTQVRLPRDVIDSPTVAEMVRHIRENRLTDAQRMDPTTPRRRVRPDPGDIDPDTISTVRRRYGDSRHFQDWETFKSRMGITARSSKDELRSAFRLWASGHYVTPKGNPASIAASSRVADIEARPYTEATEPQARIPPGTTEETTLQRIIELQAELETAISWARRQEINAELQALPSLKRASEDVGEAAAKRVARLRFGVDPAQVATRRGSGVPDLIFTDPATQRLVVIEAKGGESQLGTRRSVDGDQMVQQGTREYLESLAQTMQQSTDADIRQQGRDLETKLANNEVDYLMVRQPYSRADGTLELPTVAKFDISRGGRR